jgi:hypothetical protein
MDRVEWGRKWKGGSIGLSMGVMGSYDMSDFFCVTSCGAFRFYDTYLRYEVCFRFFI